MSRIAPLALLIVIVAGCAAGAIGTALPTPTGVNIAPPDPGLAPELAAFSGTWEGIWDGVLASRLIVEQIDADSARVVYIWGDDPGGYFKAGWSRSRATTFPGGKIKWGGQIRFTFTMSRDRMSIEGERETQGRVNTVTMKKVAQ